MAVKKGQEYTTIKNLQTEVGKVIQKHVKFGMTLLLVLVIGFGGWAVFAKIDKAAIAVGEIVPGGNNRVVQHLEGGVIEQILVKDGDAVKEGDVMIKLSKTSASAFFEIYSSTYNQSVAEYARLKAERDDMDIVIYPEEWQKDPEKYKSFMDTQDKIFKERQSGYKSKVDILNERIKQFESEIEGLQAQLAAAGKQLEYTNKEIVGVEKLLASGNTTMSRILSLKSKRSEIEGTMGQLKSSIAKTNQAISENNLNIVNLKNENLNEVVEKIKEAEGKLNEFKEKGGAASDTLSRTEIKAPVSGIVKDLKYKTAGSAGVIPPNGEVLTIVPIADQMIAEVKINPNDIDVVRKPNLKTRVRLSAYSARHIPMLDGVLKYVSADVFTDKTNGSHYYVGQVEIDTSLLKKYTEGKEAINKDQLLYPGMPVEVYIVTGERSPLSYFTDPVRNDFRRAFREE